MNGMKSFHDDGDVPVVFLIIVVVHVAPHASNFLPNVVVLLGSFVGNVDRAEYAIRSVGCDHETIALRTVQTRIM